MKMCTYGNCKRRHRAKGYCQIHYFRSRTGKNLSDPIYKREKHETVSHPLYKTWCKMRSRCRYSGDDRYQYYGGRGIKVCKRWDSFPLFLEDMGERPQGMTLDRINNDGNYTPKNCKWSTRSEQNLNRRKPSIKKR